MSSVSRHLARRNAAQVLYQWDINGRAPLEHDDLALTNNSGMFRRADHEYFHDLVDNVMERWQLLDLMLSPHLGRDIEQVDPVERAVMRIAALELERGEMPYRSVINEAVEIARLYGAENSFRFVNGVLDQLAAGSSPAAYNAGTNAPG